MSDIAERVVTAFEMFSMANLRTRSTGIQGVTIYCSQGEFMGKQSVHGPRVKVYLGEKLTREQLAEPVIVKLTTPPEIVVGELNGSTKKKVFKFLEQNHDLLIRYWNDLNMDLEDLIGEIEKV